MEFPVLASKLAEFLSNFSFSAIEVVRNTQALGDKWKRYLLLPSIFPMKIIHNKHDCIELTKKMYLFYGTDK